MKIVVTGGSGMVGRNIKDVIEGSSFYSHENTNFHFLSSKDVDLTNREDVLNFFKDKNYHCIIHLAANVGGLYKNMAGNINMFSSNIKINENILEACHLNGIKRGIFCLSSCIYPANPSKFPMDETMIHESPPHPSNEGYAYAKRMLEVQCRHYNKSYGYEFYCVVPVNLYGKYDYFNLKDGHFIPMIMHRFHLSKNYDTLTAYGTGAPLRQFLYAKDFAEIILFILFNTKIPVQTIICCDNNEFTIKEVVHKLLDVMELSKDKLTWLNEYSDGCMKKTVTNKKLLSLMGVKFTNFDDGLKETYKWFTENYYDVRK